MFESRTWYKEVSIIVLVAFLISFIVEIFVPFPYFLLIYIILLNIFGLWRIKIKKAITGKEFLTIYLILLGLNFTTNLVVPWPFSILVSIPLLFLIIWTLHKRAVKWIMNKSTAKRELRIQYHFEFKILNLSRTKTSILKNGSILQVLGFYYFCIEICL